MASARDQELTDRFETFFREHRSSAIADLARQYPREAKSLEIDYGDLFRFDPDFADDLLETPTRFIDAAEEALRLYDLPVDKDLANAHVRITDLPDATEIRDIRAEHLGTLIAVQGIVRKATSVKPKIEQAAFECLRCGTITVVPQADGDFQDPYQCDGCEREGPFQFLTDANDTEFVDAQKLRVQESPEGLGGGETPESIDMHIEDDITGEVSPGDHVTAVGVLRLDDSDIDSTDSRVFDMYLEGVSVTIEDEEFEEMEITDAEREEIIQLSEQSDIYEQIVDSIAPTIYGFGTAKLAIALQLFSGVTKHLPDGARIRGDVHILLVGDPGTGKSQLLQYIRHVSPRSVYTSGKGSSAAGLTAAAVRDDFGDGQQWSLEAGALVLADKGVAAIDELDKMACVTGDTLVSLGDGEIERIREVAHEQATTGSIEPLENGRTIREVEGVSVKTMTEDGSIEERPVNAIHEYDTSGELCEVTLESGESLTATPDHPFIVLDGGERVEKPASELSDKDWVFVPDVSSPIAGDGGKSITRPVSGQQASVEKSVEALAAVLGYLSGDGNVYYDTDEGSYGIRFINKEEELLSHFERVAERTFPVSPVRHRSEQRSDGVETVRVPGKSVANTVLEEGMNLEIYEKKAFPTGLTKMGRVPKAAFVRALADSEGSVDVKTGNVKIHSSSRELLTGTKEILRQFGVSSQIQYRHRESKRDRFILAVTDATSLAHFRSHIGFTLSRKQESLEKVAKKVDGNRTILDVIPNIDPQLKEIRTQLRLHQSECGTSAYGDFERGAANTSIHRAKDILKSFEERITEARADLKRLDQEVTWDELAKLRNRYHVSQSDLSTEIAKSQQLISERWGTDSQLKQSVRNALQNILESVSKTDLEWFRSLVRGDVKWRRVESVDSTTKEQFDDQIPQLREDLAQSIGCSVRKAERQGRSLIGDGIDLSDWDDIIHSIDKFDISQSELSEKVDVDQSTISRWINEKVEPSELDPVLSATEDLISEKRQRIVNILSEIEERTGTKVYDLTVEGTHNFIANGMVVHNSDDRSAMHEALEQQSISISKAGINATLKSRCALLGAANPELGRFDRYETPANQIDLEPALISRFDLIFTVTDQPDEEKDQNLAAHILRTNYAGELNTHRTQVSTSNVSEGDVETATESVSPAIDPELMRKYIAYARSTCFPTMTDEAESKIREFYVDLRAQGTGEDSPVPVTARKLEAIVRLAEASARVRLSDTVETEDAERALDIVETTLKEIGMDPETGQYDADVIETGQSKTQRDRIRTIKELIVDIESEFDDGAPIEEVLARAEEIDMERSKAEHEIEKLKQKGEVYEPSTEHLRTT